MAAIETALLMMPFLTLLLLIIGTGLDFTLQSSLDVGVLTTVEGLRSTMMASTSYSLPSASTLKSTIIANSGSVLTVANLAVDVRQLATLSSSVIAIADGTDDWGSSGSVLIVRAQATLPTLPFFLPVTLNSMAIVRRPLS